MNKTFERCMSVYAGKEFDGVTYIQTAEALREKILSYEPAAGEEAKTAKDTAAKTGRADLYEEFAVLLSVRREDGASYPKVNIRGIDIAALMATEAVRIQNQARYEYAQAMEGHIREAVRRWPKLSLTEAQDIYSKTQIIGIGLDWNVDFDERDLCEMGRKGFTNLADMFSAMPDGINISAAQTEAGVRFCLAGVDVSGTLMDRRDYYALPSEWRPKTMPSFVQCRDVVRPVARVDRELLEMAGAVFSVIGPNMAQMGQLQTILSSELVIGRKRPMEAMVSIISKMGRRMENLGALYRESRLELERFEGRAPAEKELSLGL